MGHSKVMDLLVEVVLLQDHLLIIQMQLLWQMGKKVQQHLMFKMILQVLVQFSFELMTAQSQLSGRFDQVQFDCSECPTRNAKSIAKQAKAAEADDECEPTADYGAISFSVLFESCDGGSGNYLDSISPPWYVIFPVAIGIILLVVIFFGGALLIDARIRKKKFERKVAKKRRARVSRMTAG